MFQAIVTQKVSFNVPLIPVLLAQVFLHRLNQYAATKMDKNITEETVKVRVHGGILTLAPSGSFRLKIVWKEREVGDPGSSCKYNLFISDSGCGVIKVALSQREGVCFRGLAYF